MNICIYNGCLVKLKLDFWYNLSVIGISYIKLVYYLILWYYNNKIKCYLIVNLKGVK